MNAPRLQEATVGIVGLGLMGTSLGLALDGRCARRIGSDVDAASAARARGLGAVDAVADIPELAHDADVVVLAMPAGQVIDEAPFVASCATPDTVITDLGSTKRAICDRLDTLLGPSVGGHPMCGRERSGPDAADAELFRGARWVLCRTTRTTTRAWRLVCELVESVGATVVELDREDHDRRVAIVSHLPYLAAQALATVSDDASKELASTGFAGATRLARGDVRMWVDVLRTNADHVRTAASAMRAELLQLERLLDDPHALERRLRDGNVAATRLHEA